MIDYAALERLSKLWEQGALSDAEFERAKAEILNAPSEPQVYQFVESAQSDPGFIVSELKNRPGCYTLIALLIITVVWNVFSEPKASVPEPPMPPEATIATSAEGLQDAFSENEIAALSTFRGETMFIYGEVDSIKANLFDLPVVNLKTGPFGGTIEIELGSEDLNFASQLQKGSRAFFICKNIDEVLGTPYPSRCKPYEPS